LRTQVDQRAAFADVLEAVRQTTLDAYDNQNVPFERLLEVLKPERSVAHAPLVQVMFNLHNQADEKLALSGIDIETFNIDRDSAKFDMSVAAVEGANGMQIGFEYSTDLFARRTIARMLQHYLKLLEVVAADAGNRVAAIELEPSYLPPVLPAGNRGIAASGATNLVTCFEQIVVMHADRPAVQTVAHRWTYMQLNAQANTVAQALVSVLKGRAKERVGLLLQQDAPMLAGLLGALKSGSTYVPLQKNAPPQRLQRIAEYADLAAIVTVADSRSIRSADY
jgi:non-ribosomal peptide synthetase component F